MHDNSVRPFSLRVARYFLIFMFAVSSVLLMGLPNSLLLSEMTGSRILGLKTVAGMTLVSLYTVLKTSSWAQPNHSAL